MAASDQEATNRRWHMTLLGVILVGAIVHHCVLFLWYVDDAAITFAYSRNLASGEGLVPFVGGERVEGYSNPAWMFFLAPFAFLGFDLIFIVRWLQPVLVAATVIVAYLAGREIFASLQEDDETGFARHGPLLAPAILAVSALFATWTSSGLEYALMDLLMALGIWRTLVELRTGEWPVSALMWLGVSLCRPEAILYAAAAGFCTMVGHFRTGRGIVPTVKWLLTFFVPFGLYHIWRYSYFAWEFPNTYYAKLERRSGFPFLEWRARTWTYTRDFAYNSGWGLFVPVWTLAATSHRGWRWSVAMAVGVVGSLVIALASPEQRLLVPALGFALAVVAWEALDRRGESNDDRPEPFVRALVIAGLVVLGLEAFRLGGVTLPTIPMPDRLLDVPPFLLVSFGAVLFGLSFEDHRVPGRPLLLSLCFAAVAFAMIAQWDWMQGYRWYAPAVGSGALLFGLGLYHLAIGVASRVVRPERRTLVAAGISIAAVLLALPPNVLETLDRVRHPDASPTAVAKRARYVQRVRDRMHLEERLRDLEVDMGGHMYWTDFEMVDIAGLVDVPMGHHKFQGRFVDEYLFKEQLPHFVHLHDKWERNSRIKRRPFWRAGGYVEIPPYETSVGPHGGNHVRRDLVLPGKWPHGGTPVDLEAGVRVHGVHVPSEPPVGGQLYIEVGVAQIDRAEQDDFRLWLTARGVGGVQRWELAPGYDWIGPTEWLDSEVFVGRYSLDVPETLSEGETTLTLTVVGADGRVRKTLDTGAPAVDVGTLTLLSRDAAGRAAEADRQAALDAAATTSCPQAEDAWFLARKHQVADPEWRQGHHDKMRRAFAECWARHSAGLPRSEQVAALVRAREHDHWAPTYRQAAGALAAELYAKGLAAREAGDVETAYRAFADAVAVDRRWSWARRYAEEARAERLGLGPKDNRKAAR